VENVLLLGQVLVSSALMASILLQTRGAGLGATFGGDSSVYRSRRGIEKRLFQFTIVLAVLFVIFSIIAFKLGEADIVVTQ
jgi:preprotein translocase subunit SecG